MHGPQPPDGADVAAAEEAALDSLAKGWEPYGRYLQLRREADLTWAAYARGLMTPAPGTGAEPEPEAG